MDESQFRLLPPDYNGRSIVNLMTTLASGLGVNAGCYPPLAPDCGLSTDQVAGARHVILLVIDGMGESLLREAPASALLQHQVAALTSVFPSTTASAIPTFLTALAPQQHGLTGWHMHFDEIDETLAVLPLQARDRNKEQRGKPYEQNVLPKCLEFATPLAQCLKGRCTFVAPRHISQSPFNLYHTAGERCLSFANPIEFFTNIVKAVTEPPAQERPSFIHAYLPDLDALMHEEGTRTAAVTTALGLLADGLVWLLNALRNRGALVIVTADHGFLDAPPSRLIEFEPDCVFSGLLARPLCGERRVAYAYVDTSKRADFEAYVALNLGHACELHASEAFLAAGWFGLGTPHSRLAGRIGDYVLLMRDDWTIKDWLPGEKRYAQLGVHGGATTDEMRVPLLVACP